MGGKGGKEQGSVPALPKVLTYSKLICHSYFAVIAVTKTEVRSPKDKKCGLNILRNIKTVTVSCAVVLVVWHRFQFY